MKTIYNQNILKTLALAACMLLAFLPQAQAQYASQRKVHFAVDWQMNAPLATDFTDKISGWGMNFEGVYDVTSHFSAGAFLSFHTNHNYVGRQTISLSPTESLTTDQQRSAFQLPLLLTLVQVVFMIPAGDFMPRLKLASKSIRTYRRTGASILPVTIAMRRTGQKH